MKGTTQRRFGQELDLLEKDVGKKASAWRSPVMPGGLFAMEKAYYWELGGYDPEIRYYGAPL